MTDQQPSYNELVLFAQRMLNDSSRANKQLDALRWQVEHEGCAASHLGETTYECRADAPCGLCRLRSERDRLRLDVAEAMALLMNHEGHIERLRVVLDQAKRALVIGRDEFGMSGAFLDAIDDLTRALAPSATPKAKGET